MPAGRRARARARAHARTHKHRGVCAGAFNIKAVGGAFSVLIEGTRRVETFVVPWFKDLCPLVPGFTMRLSLPKGAMLTMITQGRLPRLDHCDMRHVSWEHERAYRTQAAEKGAWQSMHTVCI